MTQVQIFNVKNIPKTLLKILINNPLKKIPTNRLREKLINNDILFNQCYTCGLNKVWNGKPLCLQLVHLDNNSYNNNIENLIIQCPNCFSQLKSSKNIVFVDTCNNCCVNVPQNINRCLLCKPCRKNNLKNISKKRLKKELTIHGFLHVQKKYSVSKIHLIDLLNS